jgi:DNA-binding CsgD family transcriptional regulator
LRWARLIEESLTGETMARIMEAGAGLDVSHLLAGIECPTLVCHAHADPLWPVKCGLQLAEGIPNARFVALEGHEGGPFTNAQSAVDAIDSFLLELFPENQKAPATTGKLPLTPRETDILRLIAAGLTSREMARRLSLSVRTVGRHITNIYDKIGARGRADATAYAMKHGISEE